VPLSYRDDGGEGDEKAGDLRYSNRMVPSSYAELRAAPAVQLEAEVEAEGESAFDVEATRAGRYSLAANLYGGDGATTPIAYSELASILPAGRSTLEFLFFGKAVRATGLDGPYLVRDLHGFWHENTQGSGMPIIETAELATQRFRAEDFSDAEWDSEEKRQRIALYQQTLDLAAAAH
jgi:hypothetical protein